LLLDAAKARDIRLAYEKDLATGKVNKLDYTAAVLAKGDMAPFSQSTVVVIEAPVAPLAAAADGKLHIKLASQSEADGTFQADKYLGPGVNGSWLTISPKLEDQAYYGLDEVTPVSSAGASVNFKKGSGAEKMVLYYPLNEFTFNGQDAQEQVLQP
jgi:hypothetical protein